MVPLPHPKIMENILISIFFLKGLGGGGGPCPTPQIIENMMISTVFGEVGVMGDFAQPAKSLKTLRFS